LHGGYLLGAVILLVYAGAESLERLAGSPTQVRLSWPEVRWLGLLAALCVLAGAINPNGWRLWAYPFGTLSSPAMQQNIAEWRSPYFHFFVYWPFLFLFGVGVISWTVAVEAPCWSDRLFFAGAVTAGLVSVRHIALFGVLAVPIIARAL